MDFKVVVMDDGSKDERIPGMLHQKVVSNEIARFMTSTNPRTEDTQSNKAARIGLQRQAAVEYFLTIGTEPYLFLMDDDIILGKGVIQEAVADFEMMRNITDANPGGLSLHAMFAHDGYRYFGQNIFCECRFSGEANMLLSRDGLQKTGNKFNDQKSGFGDTQIKAIRDAGLRYYTRVRPPYAVQHIGIGLGGSVIHAGVVRQPKWTCHPYRHLFKEDQGKLVCVPGFNIIRYTELLGQVDPSQAPLVYLDRIKELSNGSE